MFKLNQQLSGNITWRDRHTDTAFYSLGQTRPDVQQCQGQGLVLVGGKIWCQYPIPKCNTFLESSHQMQSYSEETRSKTIYFTEK